jgi:hypothetical protein
MLGKTNDGAAVELDVETLIGSHLGIQGNAGAGKSRTIRKLLELAAGRAQRIVLDVEDEFYTLREASPQLVLAGGANGDCSATVENAADLAIFLLETGLDAVVQINSLGLDGRREFIARFLDALIGAPRQLWHPALVVLDETHRYCPQDGWTPSTGAVVALASEGRKRGFTAVFATQRLAKIHKDAIGDINNWLLGRVGQTRDRDAAADQLGFRPRSEEALGLAKLRPGSFWGFGPAISPEPVLFQVGDPVTTHLKSGQRDVPTPPAPSELRAMMERLAAKPKAEPEKLPSQVATDVQRKLIVLERQVEQLSAELDLAKRDAIAAETRGFREAVQMFRAAMAPVEQRLDEIAIEASDQLRAATPSTFPDHINRDGTGEWRQEPTKSDEIRQEPPAEPWHTGRIGGARVKRAIASTIVDAKLPGPQQRILDALAWWEAIGIAIATRVQVAVASGGSFRNPLGALNSAGLVRYPGQGTVELTDEGRKLTRAPERSGSLRDLHDMVLALLDGPRRRILTPLLGAYPSPMPRERLAAASGYEAAGGSFRNPLGALRSIGFVDYPQKGTVRAADILFPKGLR